MSTAPDATVVVRGAVATFAAALGQAPGSSAVDAALDLVAALTGHRPEPDGVGAIGSKGAGVFLEVERGRVCRVVVRVRPSRGYQPFARPEALLEGVTPASTREEVRALMGGSTETRADIAARRPGMDVFVVDGRRTLTLMWDTADGGLVDVIVRAPGRVREQPAVVRVTEVFGAAASAAATEEAPVLTHELQHPLTVSCDDGVLSLLDLATYRAEVGAGDLDTVRAHLLAEMAAQHAIVWRADPPDAGRWTLDVRDTASSAPARQEVSATIDVTTGRLHVVAWVDVTTAAEGPGGQLPSPESADQVLERPPGRYLVTLRVLRDPAPPSAPATDVVEVVLAPTDEALVPETLLWWPEGV